MGSSGSCHCNRLQWGRNFIVAEMHGRIVREPRDQPDASMGPQLYRCGNAVERQGLNADCPASMGPQLYRCGNRNTSGIEGGYGCVLQWGRNFIVAEMTSTSSRPTMQTPCFNGAATLSLRKSSPRVLATSISFNGAATMGLLAAMGLGGLTLQWGRNFIVAEIYPFVVGYV